MRLLRWCYRSPRAAGDRASAKPPLERSHHGMMPDMIDYPDLLETLPYIIDRKEEGTPPSPELLVTIKNCIAKRK